MSSEIIKFNGEHLKSIISQDMNKHQRDVFPDELIEQIEKRSCQITILYKDKIMLCGGVTPYWPGRAELWSVFSENSRQYLVPTIRAMKWWIREQIKLNFRRLEWASSVDNLNSKRMAKIIGFKLEIECAKNYLPNGEDCSIFSM